MLDLALVMIPAFAMKVGKFAKNGFTRREIATLIRDAEAIIGVLREAAKDAADD